MQYIVRNVFDNFVTTSNCIIMDMHRYGFLLLAIILPLPALSQVPDKAQITVDLHHPTAEISPDLYGVFFEDINRASDGGLYAEMIFNRGFEEANLPSECTYKDGRVYAPYKAVYSSPEHKRSFSFEWDNSDPHPGWSVTAPMGTVLSESVEPTDHLNVPDSKVMVLDIRKYTGPVRLENTGFYGLAVEKGKKYDLRMYLRAFKGYTGSVTAEFLSADGKVLVSKTFPLPGNGQWQYIEGTLTAPVTMNDGRFALRFNSKGKIEADYISLFPQETFRGHKNGLRPDVAEYIASLKPAFMRWPGGCIVEGLTMENRVDWKKTIGAPELRHGEYNTWGYHSTWGFGYHEFLQYCEDIGAKPMFVCNAGMSCDGRNGDFYDEEGVQRLIQDALDAIEYATGDVSTPWGAERARNGHPEPFTLPFIEIGNENHSRMYAGNYDKFYRRIREAYPDITIITCLPISEQLRWIEDFDICDPHFYNAPNFYYDNTDYFDKVPRDGKHKVYVGEYACNMGVGTGNMGGALSEGAFMMGFERNSDLVIMSSYAPLLENINCRIGVNLILIKNDDVTGRSSYWVERMFTDNRPDVNLAIDTQLVPVNDRSVPCGGIGLGTWETSASFSNIKVYADGKEVYASDIAGHPEEWKPASGGWRIEGDTITMVPEFGTGTIMLTGHSFDASKADVLSIEFDAVKHAGKEGFALVFGAQDGDPRNCYQMALGAFGNDITIFQSKVNDNAVVLNNVERPHLRIDSLRPYHVKVVVRNQKTFECWLDGKKILTYDNTYIQRQYTLAGLDREASEIVLKVINAEEVPMRSQLHFPGASLAPQGTAITLKADSRYDENTFEDKEKIIPVTTVLEGVAPEMEYTFAPLSMTVLRLPVKR